MIERSKQGAIDVVQASDPINIDYAEMFRNVFSIYAEAGQPHVVLDLQAIPLIDSAGLELLLDIQEKYRHRGGTLKLAAANPLCRDILHVTGMDKLFEIYDDSVTAVGSFVR
ncbi:MAG: STAS domain-containing protein [Pirellulales bacterium]|nr:STAS domain-containing protein [Pirellulales bacterium]